VPIAVNSATAYSIQPQNGAPAELGMAEVDTGVKDVHPDAGSLGGVAISTAEGKQALIDSVQANGSARLNHRLTRQKNFLVLFHERHGWIPPESRHC
jgi:hypothetical protein